MSRHDETVMREHDRDAILRQLSKPISEKGLPAEELVPGRSKPSTVRRAVRNVQDEWTGKGGGKETNRLVPMG